MILFLAVSTIAFGFLAWVRRPLSVALLIVLLPVYQIRYEAFGIPFTLLEVFILLLTLVWLAQTLMKQEKIHIPYLWAVIAFVLAGTIATAVSVDIRAGLGLWKAYILEPVFVYVVYVHTIRTTADRRRIQWALITLLSSIGLVALMQSAGWIHIPEPYASEIPQRATSVYPFPTAIGKITDQLIAFSLAFVVFFWSSLRHGMHRRLLGFSVATALGIAGLFVSVNRGALVGVAAAFFLFALLSKRRALTISLFALCGIALLFVPVVQSQLQRVFTRNDTSADVHVVMWQGTWRLITHHPVTGAGLGGFPVLYNEYRDASHVELFPNPDSLYLTLWSEMGIYGIAAFVWIFFLWVRGSIRAIRCGSYGDVQWLVGAATLAALIAFLVHGIVDTPYFKNDLAVLFWVLFAIVVQNEKRVAN